MDRFSERNTLGLDDDLDSVELLEEVERVFGITIAHEEAAKMYTVGDLYSVIVQKLPSQSGEKCRTQMAFYRLRHALAPIAPDQKLVPSTPIGRITPQSPRKLLRFVERATSMKPPPTEQTLVGDLGVLLLLASFVAIPILAFARFNYWAVWPALIFSLLLSIVLIRADPRKFFQSDTTLGGLATSITTHNYGKLIRLGGKHDEASAWEALREIMAHFTEGIEKKEIRADTILLHSQFRAHKDANHE